MAGPDRVSATDAVKNKLQLTETNPDDFGHNEEQISRSEEKTISEFDNLTIDDKKKPDDSNIHVSGDTPYASAATFEDFKLSPELIKGLYVEMKFQKPSKIQAVSLPIILNPPYKDLIAQAHNGSGKTTCFVLGMLSRVDPSLKKTQALCICPTRELAIQNLVVLQKMGKYTGITSESAIPPIERENERTRSRRPPVSAQIVIGTPGTIKRWMSPKILSVTDMKILVFDEADHMLATDGFQDDSLKILKEIQRGNAQCQYKVTCANEDAKRAVVIERILEFGEKMGQAIIFVKSKDSATKLHNSLTEMGYEVTTIHGAVDKGIRDKIVKEFKDGLTTVLISTDLLARGFDQQQVNLVVNYDLPVNFKNPSEPNYDVYLHRVGRAGRFGRKGAVFNFVTNSRDQTILNKIEKNFETNIIEVPPSNSEEDFKVAMKAAGLM
ncbi:ATP-dependent RNA helicase DBP5 [Euphorbia peplus]|nr:ATP-dependent RNA helicase DBP5 [Euphorbia peplus]